MGAPIWPQEFLIRPEESFSYFLLPSHLSPSLLLPNGRVQFSRTLGKQGEGKEEGRSENWERGRERHSGIIREWCNSAGAKMANHGLDKERGERRPINYISNLVHFVAALAYFATQFCHIELAFRLLASSIYPLVNHSNLLPFWLTLPSRKEGRAQIIRSALPELHVTNNVYICKLRGLRLRISSLESKFFSQKWLGEMTNCHFMRVIYRQHSRKKTPIGEKKESPLYATQRVKDKRSWQSDTRCCCCVYLNKKPVSSWGDTQTKQPQQQQAKCTTATGWIMTAYLTKAKGRQRIHAEKKIFWLVFYLLFPI